MRVAPMGSETGAFASMVMSYWEQACALLNYGLLHEDLFFGNQRRVFRCLGDGQAGCSCIPRAFRRQDVLRQPGKNRATVMRNGRVPCWAGHIAAMREFMKEMRTQLRKAA